MGNVITVPEVSYINRGLGVEIMYVFFNQKLFSTHELSRESFAKIGIF